MMKHTLSGLTTQAKPKHRVLTALLVLALMQMLSTSSVHSSEVVVDGKVVRVVDGDTVAMRTATGKQITLRLAGIDAPEKNMPYGDQAKQMLIHLVGSGEITAHTGKTDRYGRTVAKVFSQGIDVNLALIEMGLAWHYKRFVFEQTSVDAKAYATSESEARASAIGLWQDARPIPPWIFRHCRKKSSGYISIETK